MKKHLDSLIETARVNTDAFDAANVVIKAQVKKAKELLEHNDLKGLKSLLEEIESRSEEIVTATIENTTL